MRHRTYSTINCILLWESSGKMIVECNPIFGEVDELISLLGKSKLLHILYVLHIQKGSLSFSQLKRRVESSSTTVSRRLTELEETGLIIRNEHDTKPVTVLYSLTDKAKLLAPAIQSMYDWCAENKLSSH